MAQPAPAFPAAGLRFLEQLADNNTTPWFHGHKSEYQELVRAPTLALVEGVNARLAKFAPRYQAVLPRAVGRPNRDTRFSADKSPYRTDIAAVFPCDGLEKHLAAGFFFRISLKGVQVIGGSVVPGPDELRKLRAFIAKNPTRFQKALADRALTKLMGAIAGEKLRKPPKPFDATHPAADLLCHKQFYFEGMLPRSAVTSPKLADEIATRFKAMTPFVRLLDEALGNFD
jgi:uncharacterized protein (TIGR02453 family)